MKTEFYLLFVRLLPRVTQRYMSKANLLMMQRHRPMNTQTQLIHEFEQSRRIHVMMTYVKR